jgi:vacuolar-type H+-ATPase subunit E/Vma4
VGTAELIEKIHADARLKVTAIQEEKKRALAEIEQQTQKIIETLKKENAERLEQRIRAMNDRARSQAQLEGRKIVLEAKWQMIDLVCTEAKKVILSSPDYPKIIEKLVKKYASPQASIHLSPDDTKRWGKVAGITPGEPVPITGGVIIRVAAAGHAAGKEELDLSLDTILNQVREEFCTELAAILFASQEKDNRSEGQE